MTSPVPAATVKASMLVKFSEERLIDLTNIDKPTLIVINNTVLDKAITDGEFYFLGEVGTESDDTFDCDLLALDYCAMYMLCRNVPLLRLYRDYYQEEADWEIRKCTQYRENFDPESVNEGDGKFHTQDAQKSTLPTPESSDNT